MLQKKFAGAPSGGIRDNFAEDVRIGLTKTQKSIPSKYLYDTRGSEYFKQIMDLPSYYLTDAETEIFTGHKNEILAAIDHSEFELVELGAGDGTKTKILLKHFVENGVKFRYLPIDISHSAVAELTDSLSQELPQLRVQGVAADYYDGLARISGLSRRPLVVMFLGSNIGNFDPPAREAFFKNIRKVMSPGDYLLMGFDLKKDLQTLREAYDDPQGVTRDFNLNLLKRMNRELGANFDHSKFRHMARYNTKASAMESHLVAKIGHSVNISRLHRTYRFEQNETIHTESSFKFDAEAFSEAIKPFGFILRNTFYDPKNRFCDGIWQIG